MARIEISIEEYNAYKNTIETLEKQVNELKKELQTNNQGIEYIRERIEELKDESIFDRIFNWQQIIKPLREVFFDEKEQEKNGTEQ